jgi:hypothetical protein
VIKFPEQEKERNRERAPTLEADLDILLSDLCVIWGFLGGLTGWELAHDGKTITADSFARAVVSVEELKPHEVTAWLPKISAAFVERYGAEVSKATFAIRE